MLISVIMAVYNDEKYIKEAIDSVLGQTYQDFEFIIIDDGSTDGTLQIIQSYRDARILLLKNEKNKGLPYSLNRGIEAAKGKYIARMDGDDICFPQRLEKQLFYMENHSHITICGSNRLLFGDGKFIKCNSPETSEQLKVRMLFGTPIAHPSWFIRKSDFDKYHFRYNENFRRSQDYELFYRVVQSCQAACVQEPLLKYRVAPKSEKSRTAEERYTMKVARKILLDLHLRPSLKELRLLLGYENNFKKVKNQIELILLYEKIISANGKSRLFDEQILKDTLDTMIHKKCGDHYYISVISRYLIRYGLRQIN